MHTGVSRFYPLQDRLTGPQYRKRMRKRSRRLSSFLSNYPEFPYLSWRNPQIMPTLWEQFVAQIRRIRT